MINALFQKQMSLEHYKRQIAGSGHVSLEPSFEVFRHVRPLYQISLTATHDEGRHFEV
jgi:hypothetical protein